MLIRYDSGEATICLQEWYNIGRALHDGRNPPTSSETAGPSSSTQYNPAHPLAALASTATRPAYIPSGRAPVVPVRKPGSIAGRPTIGQTISQPVKLPVEFKRISITATDPVRPVPLRFILNTEVNSTRHLHIATEQVRSACRYHSRISRMENYRPNRRNTTS